MNLEAWGPLFSAISVTISAVMAWQLFRLNKGQDDAASAVKQVATVLKETTTVQAEGLEGLKRMGAATHELVNSKMAAQLLLTKTALRRVADLTGDTADMEAADLAEELYGEHAAKQALVDSLPGTDAEKAGR